MPMLSSGRHVGFSNEYIRITISEGSDEARSVAMIRFRRSVKSPDALRNETAVILYRDNQPPPQGEPYLAGYAAGEIFEGKTDWSPADIADLEAFFRTDRARAWLQAEFDEIDELIKSSPVWQSELWMGD